MIARFLSGFFGRRKKVTIEDMEISKWLPISMVESSWDEIVIKNDRGWLRICTCLRGGSGRLAFYDHNEIEIIGFKPTMFLNLNEPVSDKDYVIAIAKYHNVAGEDLK